MFSKKQLEDAFDFVANRDDWRGPINAVIPAEKQEVTAEAILFYTATTAKFSPYAKDLLRCESIGYRNGPAGP